ncbi:zona pellucida sperm-binding 4-like protein [Labeo rohita]|uniref:Zona pellucida sperm-binding 4-like protein n=1 Tax=Labeo rohita TaxID=84645 RepID=A0A498LXV8_LABRO|nr:zona pellucida sperm-binding 4-like protein [Labeo rohita]
MKVILPAGSLSQVKILGVSVIESVLGAPAACGYSLTQGYGHTILVVDYDGCHVTLEGGRYTLRVLYPDEAGQLDVATLSCDSNQHLSASLKHLSVQSDQTPTCAKLPLPMTSQSSPPLSAPNMLPLTSKPEGCNISADQRVSCSASGITQDECLAKGCCFDATTSVCYYPMDVRLICLNLLVFPECTADKNFVFAVYNDFTNIHVNPMSLMVAGKTGCKPVIANEDFAIFKFSVTECGTRSFVIGETTVYLAEVQTIIKVRNLKYGVISRDNPIRFLKMFFENDETFTKFYPQCHQPLNVLLGKPVYLELRLKSPKPAATLIVHYCVAYPRSARSALILIFEGCPNPLDSGNISILYMKHLPQYRHKRRFEIKAFQFMDLSTNKYLNEEIYFMCSTEVCMPSELPCAETCFDGKSP